MGFFFTLSEYGNIEHVTKLQANEKKFKFYARDKLSNATRRSTQFFGFESSQQKTHSIHCTCVRLKLLNCILGQTFLFYGLQTFWGFIQCRDSE